jgi:alanine racemase
MAASLTTLKMSYARPILATIHIESMKHNWRWPSQSPGAKAWGVLKANGYGHGLERAMRGFAEPTAWR